jgi:nucleotide-binding universal stress UspA family protein
MTESNDLSPVQRVLVSLDDSWCGREALEAAANLASELQAELKGLFVEDINLFRLAGLPFVREITTSSGISRRVDVDSMERALQKKAEYIEEALASTAKQAQLKWSFSVARGRIMQRTWAESAEADVIIFGSRGHAPPARAWLGHARTEATHPILAVYDESPNQQRVVETAVALARRYERELVILILADNSRKYSELVGGLHAALDSSNMSNVAISPPIVSDNELLHTANQRQGSLLLIGRSCPLLNEATLESLVENLDCPIGIV